MTGARASNVPVDVSSDSGTATYIVDEGLGGALWFKLGTAHFTAGANATTGSVRVRTDGTNGNVVADAVRFVTAGTPSNSRIEPYTPVDTPRLLDGLGWNVSRLNESEFEKVKLARGKEVRLVDFGWNSIEPYAAGAPLALNSTHTNALLWCQKYGLEPLIVAAYGPPSAEIATLTVTSNVPKDSYVIPVSGTAALPYTDVSNAAPIVVDNPAATVTGAWTTNASIGGTWGADYLKDGNTGKGTNSVRWTPSLPAAGEYDIYIRYAFGSADNVPVDVITAAGTETVTVSQQMDYAKWVWLKRAQCNAGTQSSVLLRTTGTTQEVNADSTAWVPVWGVDAPIHACHVRKSDNSQIVPDGKWNTTGAGSSRVLADQAWEINGAGAGAAGSADALWFESYAKTGNFLAHVRLQSLTGGAGARAGLMLREGTDAGARFVQVGAGGDATTRFTSRQPAGAAATPEQSAPAQNQYAFPDKWLLLERIGDVVTIRVDDNNSGYTEIAHVTLSGLSASLQLGLFTASGDAGPAARAVFSDFEFSELTTWTGLAATQSWSNANNWSFTPPATAIAPNSGDSTRVFNVVIPSGTVAADGSSYVSGDPENTGRRIGSITIGAAATVLRHTNVGVAYRDFFTGRNFLLSVPTTSGVVDNRGTLRNQTAGSDWLFKWSPVRHVNAGTIEARNANAKVKFTFSGATIDNTGGSITATAGGIVDFENTSSLVVQGGMLSTDAASPTKSQLQSIPTSLGSGTLASLNFLDAQIANAGTFIHDAATSQTGTRNHLTQFSGGTVLTNTGTFKVRQTMTSTDPGTQSQTSTVEFRGSAQLVNQASGSVVVTNESTSTSPGTTGLQRAVRLDFPESSTTFTNLGTVTITDTAATAGLNASAELRSTAPFTNQGQINVTGARSFLTMVGAEPYRQTAGSTVLSGATIAAANTSIEGGALKGSGTISGNLALNGTSVFEAQLQSNGTGNLIQVTGTAELGGALQVTLPGGYDPAAGTEFRIMMASGGFTGAFAAVPISWQVVMRGTDLILVRESFSLWTGAYFTASELNQPSITATAPKLSRPATRCR